VQITIPNPQRVRKVGNSLVVTIPAEIAERHNLKEGDLVQVTVEPVQQITVPRLPEELLDALDQVLERDQDALRYLGGRPVSPESQERSP